MDKEARETLAHFYSPPVGCVAESPPGLSADPVAAGRTRSLLPVRTLHRDRALLGPVRRRHADREPALVAAEPLAAVRGQPRGHGLQLHRRPTRLRCGHGASRRRPPRGAAAVLRHVPGAQGRPLLRRRGVLRR